MIPISWSRYGLLATALFLLVQGWRWRRRRARRARKPALLQVSVPWPGWLLSRRLEKIMNWLLCGVMAAVWLLLFVMTLAGQGNVEELGMGFLYGAAALNLFLLLRGPETLAIRRGGVSWKIRAFRWREIYDYEIAAQGANATLTLKTRRERVQFRPPQWNRSSKCWSRFALASTKILRTCGVSAK